MKAKLLIIYNRLFEHFGPRYWWPADSPLEMALGAILVQNVSWNNTVKALENLKREGLLSIAGLYGVPESLLEELIRSTRYYKTKARKVKSFAGYIMEKYQGDLAEFLALPLRSLRCELLSIYGIGEETADSIILYGSNQPIFVVDAYTKRIFHRLGLFPEKIKYRTMQEFFMEHLSPDVQIYNEYHALIDCLGNRLCSAKKPQCTLCPLADMCGQDS